MPARVRPYLQLMRLDRPIGTWLLFWPCVFGLVLGAAADERRFLDWRDFYYVILFGVGAVVMRGAGCTFNDIIDRDIDAQVARTRGRPIPSGAVTTKQAAALLVGLCLVGLAILLQLNWFAVGLGWLPSGGYVAFSDDPWGWFRTSTMPAVSLALLNVGLLARVTRSTMLEVLRQDYVRTARAKGLPRWSVVGKHALANAMIPITTVVGIIISLLVSGSVVTETLFSIPGIGQLLTSAVLGRDYPMVQGGLLLVTAMLVMINLGVDLLYAALDPRIRYER